MNNAVPFPEFKTLYEDCLESVCLHWKPRMQSEIATHCNGWRPGCFDFHNYLSRSVVRYYKAYEAITRWGGPSVCDIGGFWGIFPLVLKRLGFHVAMTEKRKFYSDAFDPLFCFLEGQGIEIIDWDPFEEGNRLPHSYDAVTLLAVLEHYPHSLKFLLRNARDIAKPRGIVYIEVPNIAYWPKRLDFFRRGITPLAPIEDIYKSEPPYIGHHHEFTMQELHTLARLSDFTILEEKYYNYSLHPTLIDILRRPIYYGFPVLSKNARECLAIVCCPKDGCRASC